MYYYFENTGIFKIYPMYTSNDTNCVIIYTITNPYSFVQITNDSSNKISMITDKASDAGKPVIYIDG